MMNLMGLEGANSNTGEQLLSLSEGDLVGVMLGFSVESKELDN